MITQFLLRQLDFIYFGYGLSFILLAIVCRLLRRESPQRLPWIWLGLFGLAHGAGEWMEMLALELWQGTAFSVAHLALTALSFVFLLEFARRGWRAMGMKEPGWWVYFPLAAAAAVGGMAGMTGLAQTVRYALGFTGAAWAAAVFVGESTRNRESRKTLRWAGAIMAVYALATGLLVSRSAFFPASVINGETFQALTGFPIQLLRGILALLFTGTLWMHYEQSRRRELPATERVRRVFLFNRFIFSGVLAFIMAMGFVFAEIVRFDADREERSDLLAVTRAAGALLDSDDVGRLAGSAADAELSEYHRLREQLLALGRSTAVRWLYLMRLQEGTVLFTVDSVPAGIFGHDEPGEGSIYEQPPPELIATFSGGETIVVGPYTDEWGSFISGFLPIRDSLGRVVGVLGIDIDHAQWRRTIAKYRLASIFITLLVVLMAVGFFTARLRNLESGQRLAASEANYRSLFENMVEGFAYCRLLFVDGRPHDFIFLKVNRAFETLTGLKEVSGKRASEVIPGIRESDPELLATYGRVTQTGVPERFESYVKALYMWFSTSVYRPEKDHFVAVFDVITARKKSEQTLLESENRFSQVAETAGEWIWEVNAQGMFRYSSAAVERMLGYTPGELVGKKHFYDLFCPEERENLKTGAMAAFERRETFRNFVNPNLHRNGSTVFLETSGSPMLDPEGNLLGYRGTDADVTERWRAEEELRTARAFLDSIINAIADPVFVKDGERRFVLVNDALCAIVGRPRESLIGEDGDDLFPPEQVEVFRQVDVAVLETGDENVNEERLSNLSTGEVRTIVTRKSRYVDPAGKRYIVGVIRDITDRKRSEEEREALIAELREAVSKVRTLSGFLPICAHCKKIRDDKGYWNQIESYIRDHSEAEFSHGICPECARLHFPGYSGT